MIDAAFWSNFWPNFWSDVLVGIVFAPIIAWLITWFIDRAKRPNAIIIARTKKVDDSTMTVEISIRNIGRVSFKSEEIYYHFIVNSNLSPREIDGESSTTAMNIFGKQYTNFSGIMNTPCFVGRLTKVSILTVKAASIQYDDILFSLSTIYGLIPRNVVPDINDYVDPNTLGKAIVEVVV